MNELIVSPSLTPSEPPVGRKNDDPVKIRDAAQQFEALLLSELLQSAHPKGGWLGGGEDGAASTANGFAEQQLSLMMAQHGGIGLANLVAKGLERTTGS